METLAAFAAASFVIELTPGPNMTYLALLAAQSGRGAGLAAASGVALGLALLGIVAVFGLSSVVSSSPIRARANHKPAEPEGAGLLCCCAADFPRFPE